MSEPTGRPDGAAKPDEEFDSTIAQVPLTVAAVAARLGVAPSTLRTWDRRYGLGPSGRSAGSHRRYTAEDVARLERMRSLTLAGAAPSDAARSAAKGRPEVVVPIRGRVEFPALDSMSLAAAAVAGEEERVRAMFDEAVRKWGGFVQVWVDLVAPALADLEKRARPDRPGYSPDHLLAGAVLAAVRERTQDAPPARVLVCGGRRLVAERLSAHVLAAGLAEKGVGAGLRLLPAPAESVLGEPAAELVVVLGSPPGAEGLVRAANERGRPVVLVGQEVPAVYLPDVQRVRTLTGAVHEIVAALAAREQAGRGSAADRSAAGASA